MRGDSASKLRTHPRKQHYCIEQKNQASYWDPSIQFENCEQHTKVVDEEKQKYIIKQKNTIQENLILKILSNGVL